MERPLLEQLLVLAQPRLDGVAAGHVVERQLRLDEVEQPLALRLDQVLLDLRHPVDGEALAAPGRHRHQAAGADAAQAGEALAERRERQVAALREVRDQAVAADSEST